MIATHRPEPTTRRHSHAGGGALERGRRLVALARSLWRPERRRGPFKLTLQVTDRCGLRCAICSLWKAPRPDPDLETLDRLFAANPDLTWLNLTGGEAVERDDFVELAERAVLRTRAALLSFPTAGGEPDRTLAAVGALLRLPLHRLGVTVSIDGPREVHDRVRGRRGAFDRALETFLSLRALPTRRLSVRVGLTLSSRNDREPEALVRRLLAETPLEPCDLHFNLAHHAPHYYRNRPGDRPDARRTAGFLDRWSRRPEVRALGGAFLDPLGSLERRYQRLAASYLEHGRSPVPCTALAGSVFVDAALRLFPCIGWDLPIADLAEFDYSIERALRSPAVRPARAAAENGTCPGCWTPCEAFPALLRLGPRPRTGAPLPGADR